MSQIIAIHREDDHAIDFAWDSCVSHTEHTLSTLSWATPKVERFCFPNGTEMAIGITGSLCLLQFLKANFDTILDGDIPAATPKGIINVVVPWMRETFDDCGVFSSGMVHVADDTDHEFVIGLAGEGKSTLTYVSASLAVVAYEQPIVCPGACSGEVRALYLSRIEEGLRVDRSWMETALRICRCLSPLIAPPWCGCTIGGTR